LKRKERAGIFRQQYNEDVKKLLKRKNKPAPKEIPVKSERKAIEPTSAEAEKVSGQVEV
jgi:SOS-response transcriptional repressor LexA